MEISIFLAQILGLVYLVIGVGVIFNSGYYHDMMKDFLKSPAILYLGGVMALLVGFLIVTYHNVWEQSWVVIITIIGWIALVKGVVLLVFPELALSSSKSFLKTKEAFAKYGIFVLALGAILSYYGFVA